MKIKNLEGMTMPVHSCEPRSEIARAIATVFTQPDSMPPLAWHHACSTRSNNDSPLLALPRGGDNPPEPLPVRGRGGLRTPPRLPTLPSVRARLERAARGWRGILPLIYPTLGRFRLITDGAAPSCSPPSQARQQTLSNACGRTPALFGQFCHILRLT